MEIEGLAAEAGEQEAEGGAQALEEQVDRVSAWGSSRQHVWSEYYQFVQRYLRDVVRLDPERALSQRLRDQIQDFWRMPYALVAAEMPPLRVLREETEAIERPQVCRPREARERAPAVTVADRRWEGMEEAVQKALQEGVPSLHALLERLLPEVPRGERFLWSGRIAARAAKYAKVLEDRDRPFAPLAGEAGLCGKDDRVLAIQDWQLSGRRT